VAYFKTTYEKALCLVGSRMPECVTVETIGQLIAELQVEQAAATGGTRETAPKRDRDPAAEEEPDAKRPRLSGSQ